MKDKIPNHKEQIPNKFQFSILEIPNNLGNNI